MNLDCIVTLANAGVRLRFLAMERSLRAAGCDLPLKVIPYNDALFDLPPHATWWEVPELIAWTRQWGTHPTMRKYQCLLIPNFQFVDADVCFLRNPEDVLRPHSGFITSCGHWHNPAETLTEGSKRFLSAQSTTWQKNIFNTGQWACDRALFDFASLRERCESEAFSDTCLTFRYHEQPGVNLLVNSSDVSIHNLTLPPWNMQSTWAGDYPGDYRRYWRTEQETPYLIHWAGTPMDRPRPIDEIFLDHLTAGERREWHEQVAATARRRAAARGGLRGRARRWRGAARAFAAALRKS